MGRTDETVTMLEKLSLVDTEAMEWQQQKTLRLLAGKEDDDDATADTFCEHAPFQQVKRQSLDEASKAKIPLKHEKQKDGIRTRKIEVMPLPPTNYERLKVQPL